MKQQTGLNYLLLLGIGILWGSQFTLNDIALRTLPSDVVAVCRMVVGALTLTVLTLLVKEKQTVKVSMLPNAWSIRLRYMLIAILEGMIPFFALAWGQKYVDSSVAAVLIGTIPLFTGLTVMLFLASEKVSVGTIVSIVIGFVGLLVLLAPSLLQAQKSSVLAEGAILGSALSFAVALALLRTMPPLPPIRMTRNILLLAAVPMLIYLLLTDPAGLLLLKGPALWSMLALGIFCSGMVYLLYVALIKRAGATFTSLSNYLVPLFGAILGVTLMHDPLTWNLVLALIIILGSLALPKLPIFKYH